MEKNKYDLTKGSILNKLIIVALPIMGTQFVQMTYNLSDMFWLGRLSSEAVASTGTVGMYLWLSMAFLMLGRMGAEIGVSQNLGSGKVEAARMYAHSSFWLAAVLGVMFGAVLIIFRGPLIGFFNIREASVVSDAEKYMVIVAVGVPFTYISSVVMGMFNGSGNTRVPFYINVIGLVINIILDPLLILIFNFGIVGAAVSTVLGQAVVCITSLVAVRYYSKRPIASFRFFHKLNKRSLPRIFKWGLPVAVESLLFTILSMLISRLVSDWGASAIAAQRVGTQIESLSWLIAGGFASAVTAYVGQNYGASQWARIHKGFRLSIDAMAVWGVMITVLLFFGSRVLFRAFLPDPQITDMGVKYLKILAYCQLIACIEATTAGCFRGMGRTLPPSIVSITCNGLRVPLAYILSKTSLGLDGVWWAITIGAAARGIFLFSWYLLQARSMPREDMSGL